jgi:hypothetical protein
MEIKLLCNTTEKKRGQMKNKMYIYPLYLKLITFFNQVDNL